MKSIKFLGLVAVLAVMAAEPALAQDATNAGESITTELVDLVQGNIGTAIGLAIALFGLWTWIVKQTTWGIVMIIGGVILTAFPGIFDNLREGVASTFQDVESAGEGSNILQ